MKPDEFEEAEYERLVRNRFAIENALSYLRVVEKVHNDFQVLKIVADLRSILDWSNR